MVWNSIPAWTTVGASQQSPNIGSVVQEIVNQQNWASGNALAIIISGSGQRVAESYNGTSTGAPKLVIEYTTTQLGGHGENYFTKDAIFLSVVGDLVSQPETSNPESPLLTITTIATYTYDGDGVMVKSVVDGVTTYYVGGYYEYQDDGVDTIERKYYSAAGMRIAVRMIVNDTTDTLNWLLGDHLGSTSMVTDASGVMVSEVRYSALGETRYQNGTLTTDYLYTGQRQEAEIGLYYYVARWYDPSIGRFVQADSIVPNPASSIGFDRYAYVNDC